MACGSLILCSSIQPRRSLELLIPRFQLLLHPSTVGPFPPSLHPWSLLTAAARRRCHRHGAVGAATTAGAATSPFCSQQQQQSLCFPSLAIIEARGSLLLTCSYHRGSHRSSLHSSSSRQKKKLGEHLLLTELTSLEQPSFAQCKRPVSKQDGRGGGGARCGARQQPPPAATAA